MMSHSLIHLPPAHHSHPPAHIHCFVPGSKLTFSTNIFHRSLLTTTGLPSRTILDRNYSAQRFSFLVIFPSFDFESCGRLSWINCQFSTVRLSGSLHHIRVTFVEQTSITLTASNFNFKLKRPSCCCCCCCCC